MPWWVKALGILAVVPLVAGFVLTLLAAGPPVNHSLEETGIQLAAVGILFGLFFLRAFFSWERIKFYARAWATGRREARERWRQRRRR